MALKDQKIKGYRQSIKSMPNTIIGQAEAVKAAFDARTDEEILKAINGMIDSLIVPGGAGEIGAQVPAGITPRPAPAAGGVASVQAVLQGLRDFTDQKIIEIGSGDMNMSIYDPARQRRNIFTKASISQEGIVKLSSDVNSTSAVMAATPAAVNLVNRALQTAATTASNTANTANNTANAAKMSVDNIINGTTSAGKAAQLSSWRTIITNLSFGKPLVFNGTQDIAPGVAGILAVANGGTGTNSLAKVIAGSAQGLQNTINGTAIANSWQMHFEQQTLVGTTTADGWLTIGYTQNYRNDFMTAVLTEYQIANANKLITTLNFNQTQWLVAVINPQGGRIPNLTLRVNTIRFRGLDTK